MKLDEKGRFQPPPPLPTPAQRVSETVASWPDVHARTHWQLGDERQVDGADFYLGQEELGHIHLDGEAHVMLPSTIAAALIRSNLAVRLPWSRSAAVFRIESSADVDHALWLFRLSYDHRAGTPTKDLLHRIAQERPADGSGRRPASSDAEAGLEPTW